MTRFLVGVGLGIFLGLTFNRIPHYIGLAMTDQPETPQDWKPKEYWYSGGKRVDHR